MFLRPRQTTDKVVAIFATLSSSQQEHLGPHQNIIFGDVETNIGGGYNYHHGVLVAPVSGLYLITATLLTSPNREIWAAIVVNGVEVARLNGRGTDGRHGPTSHSVIIQLQRGNRCVFDILDMVKSLPIDGNFIEFVFVLLSDPHDACRTQKKTYILILDMRIENCLSPVVW
jgi:hypothetical protein